MALPKTKWEEAEEKRRADLDKTDRLAHKQVGKKLRIPHTQAHTRFWDFMINTQPSVAATVILLAGLFLMAKAIVWGLASTYLPTASGGIAATLFVLLPVMLLVGALLALGVKRTADREERMQGHRTSGN